MRRRTFACATVVATLIAGFLIARPRQTGSPREAAHDDTPRFVREGARSVSAPQPLATVRRPRAPQRVALPRPSAAARASSQLSPPPPAADEVVARWEREKPDPQATDDLTAYVSSAFQDLAIDGEIDELTCRETLCRVNVHFADLRQALAYQEEAALIARRKKIEVSVTDGIVDVEVFLARE